MNDSAEIAEKLRRIVTDLESLRERCREIRHDDTLRPTGVVDRMGAIAREAERAQVEARSSLEWLERGEALS